MDPLDQLYQRLRLLPDDHKIAFAALIAERLLRHYEEYAPPKEACNVDAYRNALEEIWSFACESKRLSRDRYEALETILSGYAPGPDDDLSADTASAFYFALLSCVDPERGTGACEVGVESASSGFNMEDDPEYWSQPRVQREVAIQNALIDNLSRLPSIDIHSRNRLRDLLPCVPKDPFPAPPHSSWLTPTVLGLARAIRADAAFERLPVLADALEEAGCRNTDIVAHCRGPGPHLPGCWVVDVLLVKQ